MDLNKNNKFKHDLDLFEDVINKITNPILLKETKTLKKKFLEQIEIINTGHSGRFGGYINPMSLRENVEMVYNIRKKLHRINKDLDST